MLGGDFNCVISSLDKRGGKPFNERKPSVVALHVFIKTNNLVDSWRFKNPDLCGFTWSNPSLKIQTRLDYLFVSKNLSSFFRECKIIPSIHSDHSAVALNMSFDQSSPPRGPGFWKFNNSLLTDTTYVQLLNSKLPEFAEKHQQVEDKGLFWEMVKMEIRAFTINYSKRKAKRVRDEEAALQMDLINIQNRLQATYSECDKVEMDRLKSKLAKITDAKTQGSIVRSRARWYEHGEKNSKYFFNLEKSNQRKKHVTSLINNENFKITDPKEILKEEELFFSQIYTSNNMNPLLPEFSVFFKSIDSVLSEEEAATCEGEVTLEECYNALKSMKSNKTPGSDGLTSEFYRYFWNEIGGYMTA